MEYTITEHNAETNEITNRPMNEKEIENYKKIQEAMENSHNELIKKEKNKTNALAKLAALGLTEEEIAAL